MLKFLKLFVILIVILLVGYYAYGIISEGKDFDFVNSIKESFSKVKTQVIDVSKEDLTEDEEPLGELTVVDSEVAEKIKEDEIQANNYKEGEKTEKKSISYFKYNPNISKEDYIKRLSTLIPESERENGFEKIIVDAAEQTKIDPIFIAVLIDKVSGFQSDAKSPNGRYGLLQVSSKAVETYNKKTEQNLDSTDSLFNPNYNLKVGLTILKIFLQNSSNNMQRAIQAFYWGDGSSLESISKKEVVPQKVQFFSENLINNYIDVLKSFKSKSVSDKHNKNTDINYPSDADIISRRFSEANIQQKDLLLNLVIDQASKTEIDSLLILSMIEALSDLNPNKVSINGNRIGLMQVDTRKGKYIEKLCHIKWKGIEALKDPIYNFVFGMSYLKFLNERVFSGNKSYAILSYMWDPKELFSALKQGDGKIPSQVQYNFKKILYLYQKYKKELKTPVISQDNINRLNKGVSSEVKLMELESRNNIITKLDTPIKSSESLSYKENPIENIEKKAESVNNNEIQLFRDEVSRLATIINSYGISKKLSIDIADGIFKSSKSVFLDPLFVSAIVKEECNFYWYAEKKSTQGKYGLFQLSLDEGKKIAARVKMSPPTEKGLKEMHTSLKLVTRYLYLLGKNFNGDKRKILLAYYGGSDRLKMAVKNKAEINVPTDINKKVESTLKTYNYWNKNYIIKR